MELGKENYLEVKYFTISAKRKLDEGGFEFYH